MSELPGVAETARRITAGETTASAALEERLARIDELDGELNAFSVVRADAARAEAAALDRQPADGTAPGPLHGVPVAVKEELAVAGCVTTFGGSANRTPAAEDGEVVRRLRAAGAVIVGKTRMPEFGQWPFTESAAGGITRNPWDPRRTPGGSSGGSAVAVATGMVPAALGSDGGGSIRIPAACCGVFGLKPARGRVSSHPMPHLWWSLGTIGPLTRSVADSALVYDVIRGNVDGDRFRIDDPEESFLGAARREPGRLRVGWHVKPVLRGPRTARQHVRAVEQTAELLAGLGHDVRQVDPHHPDPSLAYLVQYLAGVRAEADAVEYFDRLEPRTRSSYRLGAWTRPGVVRHALRSGERIAERANRVFDDVDVLLTPTIAHRPRLVGALDNGGPVRAAVRATPMITYTALWNVTGNPAASVPAGLGTDGVPLAVQLVGRRGDETTLLSLSAQLERARPWPCFSSPIGPAIEPGPGDA